MHVLVWLVIPEVDEEKFLWLCCDALHGQAVPDRKGLPVVVVTRGSGGNIVRGNVLSMLLIVPDRKGLPVVVVTGDKRKWGSVTVSC